jgi:hypothetical protein
VVILRDGEVMGGFVLQGSEVGHVEKVKSVLKRVLLVVACAVGRWRTNKLTLYLTNSIFTLLHFYTFL